MAAIAAHDDPPDDDEHADREQQMYPPWSVEDQCGEHPQHEHRNADEDSKIHLLTVFVLVFNLLWSCTEATARDGEFSF
jgi:hypothetical protein